MKKPFSFPVGFIEELNALNFSYKSIHLMAHHSQWFADWTVGSSPMLSKEWHGKYINSENILKLDSEKPNCTRFHYLFRFVDIDDNISYGFEPIHHFCEEWNFAGDTNNNLSKTYDPFGFGYNSNIFKEYVFSNITFCSADMLKRPTKNSIFQIIATAPPKKTSKQIFGEYQTSFIDNEKSVMLYREASKVSIYTDSFIAAFFGFDKYTSLSYNSISSCYFAQSPTYVVEGNTDLAALFYRDC